MFETVFSPVRNDAAPGPHPFKPMRLCEDTPMNSVLKLCQGLPEQRFAPAEVLLAEGGTDGKLYVLIEGEVEISKEDTPLHTQDDPGAIFGEVSVLLHLPHTATVTATRPCRAYRIDDGTAFLRDHPDFAFHLSTLLARRLHSITGYLVDLKRQFADHADHFGLVDEVLDNLLYQQPWPVPSDPERYPQ